MPRGRPGLKVLGTAGALAGALGGAEGLWGGAAGIWGPAARVAAQDDGLRPPQTDQVADFTAEELAEIFGASGAAADPILPVIAPRLRRSRRNATSSLDASVAAGQADGGEGGAEDGAAGGDNDVLPAALLNRTDEELLDIFGGSADLLPLQDLPVNELQFPLHGNALAAAGEVDEEGGGERGARERAVGDVLPAAARLPAAPPAARRPSRNRNRPFRNRNGAPPPAANEFVPCTSHDACQSAAGSGCFCSKAAGFANAPGYCACYVPAGRPGAAAAHVSRPAPPDINVLSMDVHGLADPARSHHAMLDLVDRATSVAALATALGSGLGDLGHAFTTTQATSTTRGQRGRRPPTEGAVAEAVANGTSQAVEAARREVRDAVRADTGVLGGLVSGVVEGLMRGRRRGRQEDALGGAPANASAGHE